AAAPAKSRAEATVAARLAGVTLDGSVSGSAAAVAWDLTGKAEAVGPVQSASLASKGQLAEGGAIEQDTTVDLGRGATAAAALGAGQIHLPSAGTGRRQQAHVTAALDGVTVRGRAAGSPRLEITATADLDRPRVELALKGAHPDADLRLAGEVDAARTVRWR